MGLVQLNTILIVITLFPIHLTSNGVPFDVKSIGKVQLQSKFGLIEQDSEMSLSVSPAVTLAVLEAMFKALEAVQIIIVGRYQIRVIRRYKAFDSVAPK